MYTTKIVSIGKNYGFEVYLDDVLVMRQEFAPGASGFQPMTRAEAETAAQAMIEAYHTPPPEPPEPPAPEPDYMAFVAGILEGWTHE